MAGTTGPEVEVAGTTGPDVEVATTRGPADELVADVGVPSGLPTEVVTTPLSAPGLLAIWFEVS